MLILLFSDLVNEEVLVQADGPPPNLLLHLVFFRRLVGLVLVIVAL